MLRHAKELEQYELRARDGKIGHVHDFLFDDRYWTVRYLVIDTGTSLNRQKVLIAPASVSRAEWDEKVLGVDLTREQVRGSPALDAEQPISRDHEVALSQYYNWPAYWGTALFPDVGLGMPGVPIIPPPPTITQNTGEAMGEKQSARDAAETRGNSTMVQDDPHVRSVRKVTGHAIEATDGEIGHVTDFLIDDRSWEIRYLIVDTRTWWSGKKVVVAPQWINEVSWDDARVYVDLTRHAIKASPAYDPSQPVTPDYAGLLHDHYGRERS
jgi:hypothetical protein